MKKELAFLDHMLKQNFTFMTSINFLSTRDENR